ncbi:MAG: DUF3943 domain-containing protein [Elusimicrobia bacterium]|nr:DUF3943 domain-containing protein [Elusimicrobiota bacterium]
MRTLLALSVLASAAGCAAAAVPRPFTSDGCSLFPDGPPARRECCLRHDRSYWLGGTRAERRAADGDFRDCVAAAGEPAAARWMYRGSRAGGTPYLPTPFRWGYGWPFPRGNAPAALARAGDSAAPARAFESVVHPSTALPVNPGPTTPDLVLPGEPPTRKNYLIPAIEIAVFQIALNVFDRRILGEDVYGSNLATAWDHLRRGAWVVDEDQFRVNQIGHPYQGAIYHGSARATGLNFWEGMLYSNVGSLVWEIAGERSRPSINDQVATGMGGPLLGEPLLRMANLVLEGSEEERPGRWREFAAALLSPPTGLNRLLFDKRYTPVLKSRGAPRFGRIQAGGGGNSMVRDPRHAGIVGRNVAVADVSMAYGHPGKPGYAYLRPLDYFTLELSTLRMRRTHYANIMTRGLLFGSGYESAGELHGIWGLYGSFDHLSPQVFRFSTTAVSLGTTLQWRLARNAVLQGSALGGIGYGTAGSIVPQGDERDYHYGATPQALVALRLILARRVMLDLAGRGYHISDIGANKAPGEEDIGRLDASVAVRVFGRHAVSLNYLVTDRRASYAAPLLASRHQTVETIGVAYNLLTDLRFGVVEDD